MKLLAMMLAGSAVLALSACGKGADEGAGGASGANQSAEDVASEMKKVALQPGEWETTQEIVDIAVEGAPEGMPHGMMEAMTGRKSTTKNCITPEQAENPSADFLTAQKDSKCTYSGFEMSGGKIKGAVSCPGGADGAGSAKVVMEGSYTPVSYAMNMEMQSEGMGGAGAPGMAMHMKMRSTGKRIGECPAGSTTE